MERGLFFCDGVDMCGDVESGDVDILWRRRRCFLFCEMDVESGCGLPWRMWMECVAMCVDGCVERVCPRELCGVRFEVRGVHASGLSSMCPSVYAMLWCYGRGFFRCMEARELVGCI